MPDISKRKKIITEDTQVEVIEIAGVGKIDLTVDNILEYTLNATTFDIGSNTLQFIDVNTTIQIAGSSIQYDVASGGEHALRIDNANEWLFGSLQANFFSNTVANMGILKFAEITQVFNGAEASIQRGSVELDIQVETSGFLGVVIGTSLQYQFGDATLDLRNNNLDVGSGVIGFTDFTNVTIGELSANELFFDVHTGGIHRFRVGNSDRLTINNTDVDIAGLGFHQDDNAKHFFGLGNDATIYYDGVDLVIDPKETGVGIVKVLGDLGIDALEFLYLDGGGNTYIYEVAPDRMEFVTNGGNHFVIATNGVAIPSGDLLNLSGFGNDTWIQEQSADDFHIYVGNELALQLEELGTEVNAVFGPRNVLATTTTNGFLYLPTMAGAPTGNSTDYTGKLPIVYDSTGDLLMINTTGTTWIPIGGPTTFTDVIPCVLEVPEGVVAYPDVHVLATQGSKITGMVMPTATDSTINFKFICPEDLAGTPNLIIRVHTLTLSVNTTDAINLTLDMRYTDDQENTDQAFNQTVTATNYSLSNATESYNHHDINPTNDPTAGELVTGQIFRDISLDDAGDVMIVGISAHIDRTTS